MVGVELEPLERVVGKQQAAVEVDPVGQRRDDRRPGDPTEVSSMQPRNVLKPSARARSSIALRRPDPAALGELDVDAGDDADEARRGPRQDAAFVGDDRQGRPFLEPAELVEAAGRERLLDELDAEALELGQEARRPRRAPSRCWRRPGSDRRRRPRTASSVARSSGPPHLILSAGKRRRAGGPLGDDAGSSMPMVKSVGGMSAERPTELVHRGRPRPCRRGRGARCRARNWPRRGRGSAASIAGSPRPGPAASGSGLADRLEQQREDDRHRLGRLAVEAVRVALPHPDDARAAVVAELDDDRGHAPIAGAVIGPGDPERVAQPEVQGLLRQVQAHPASTQGSASTPSRIARPETVGPKRNGSSVGRPVSPRSPR